MAVITGHLWSFVKILENKAAFPLGARRGSARCEASLPSWKQEMPEWVQQWVQAPLGTFRNTCCFTYTARVMQRSYCLCCELRKVKTSVKRFAISPIDSEI